jgi:predicted peptidase
MSRPDLQLVASGSLPYLLSRPRRSTLPSGVWPVLCFLHGYDEAAPLEIHRALTRHGPLRPGNPPTALDDCIVVVPQLPAPGGDVWRRYAPEVEQIIGLVQARYRGDAQRTYLTGFSFGGNGVFDLALRQRNVWAALWPVDPTRVPAEDPQVPIWLSSGEVSRRRRAGFIARLHLGSLGDDAVADRIYVDRGLDHVGTATEAYRDERIYAWLLTKRLSGAT